MSHHDEQIQAIVSSATHGRDKALAELQHEATKAELAKQGERRAKDAFDDAMELVGILLRAITDRGTLRKGSKRNIAHARAEFAKLQIRERD